MKLSWFTVSCLRGTSNGPSLLAEISGQGCLWPLGRLKRDGCRQVLHKVIWHVVPSTKLCKPAVSMSPVSTKLRKGDIESASVRHWQAVKLSADLQNSAFFREFLVIPEISEKSWGRGGGLGQELFGLQKWFIYQNLQNAWQSCLRCVFMEKCKIESNC